MFRGCLLKMKEHLSFHMYQEMVAQMVVRWSGESLEVIEVGGKYQDFMKFLVDRRLRW